MTAEATATASAEATGTATPSATLTFTATATASAAKTLAPGTETPTTSATETPTGAGTETPTGDRIGICHRTGSEKNPWRYIEISKNAVEAHRAHGDIIDVGSPAECPQAGTEPPVP
jgi:hypothetical protein